MYFKRVAVVALATMACRTNEQQSGLMPASPEACRPDAYLLELPVGGGFVLNSEQRDSTGVMRWLNDVLPKRDSSGKVVNVRMDATRQDVLAWLVPAIQKAGGKAYEFDPSCRISIPARS